MALPGNCPPGCASRPYAAHFAAFSAALRVVWGRSLVDQGAAPARRSVISSITATLFVDSHFLEPSSPGPHGAHPKPRAPPGAVIALSQADSSWPPVREHVLGRAGRATGWPRTPAQDAVLGWAGGVPGGAHRLRPPRGGAALARAPADVDPARPARVLADERPGLEPGCCPRVAAVRARAVGVRLPARPGRHAPFSTHVQPQLRADEILFGGTAPTVWLQERLARLVDLHWYDYVTWVVYVSYFLATYLVAAFLWFFARGLFRRFVAMVSLLALMGFATYALFPAAPPWMASEFGQLEPTTRSIGSIWNHIPIAYFDSLFDRGSEYANPVAAVPSLHAAYTLLIALFSGVSPPVGPGPAGRLPTRDGIRARLHGRALLRGHPRRRPTPWSHSGRSTTWPTGLPALELLALACERPTSDRPLDVPCDARPQRRPSKTSRARMCSRSVQAPTGAHPAASMRVLGSAPSQTGAAIRTADALGYE